MRACAETCCRANRRGAECSGHAAVGEQFSRVEVSCAGSEHGRRQKAGISRRTPESVTVLGSWLGSCQTASSTWGPDTLMARLAAGEVSQRLLPGQLERKPSKTNSGDQPPGVGQAPSCSSSGTASTTASTTDRRGREGVEKKPHSKGKGTAKESG